MEVVLARCTLDTAGVRDRLKQHSHTIHHVIRAGFKHEERPRRLGSFVSIENKQGGSSDPCAQLPRSMDNLILRLYNFQEGF